MSGPVLHHGQLTKSAALQVCLITIEFSEYDSKSSIKFSLQSSTMCVLPRSCLCRIPALAVSGPGARALGVGPALRIGALCRAPALFVLGPGVGARPSLCHPSGQRAPADPRGPPTQSRVASIRSAGPQPSARRSHPVHGPPAQIPVRKPPASVPTIKANPCTAPSSDPCPFTVLFTHSLTRP